MGVEQLGIRRNWRQPAVPELRVRGDAKGWLKAEEVQQEMNRLMLFLKAQQATLDTIASELSKKLNEVILNGTTTNRPAATNPDLKKSQLYWNSTLARLELFDGSAWYYSTWAAV